MSSMSTSTTQNRRAPDLPSLVLNRIFDWVAQSHAEAECTLLSAGGQEPCPFFWYKTESEYLAWRELRNFRLVCKSWDAVARSRDRQELHANDFSSIGQRAAYLLSSADHAREVRRLYLHVNLVTERTWEVGRAVVELFKLVPNIESLVFGKSSGPSGRRQPSRPGMKHSTAKVEQWLGLGKVALHQMIIECFPALRYLEMGLTGLSTSAVLDLACALPDLTGLVLGSCCCEPTFYSAPLVLRPMSKALTRFWAPDMTLSVRDFDTLFGHNECRLEWLACGLDVEREYEAVDLDSFGRLRWSYRLSLLRQRDREDDLKRICKWFKRNGRFLELLQLTFRSTVLECECFPDPNDPADLDDEEQEEELEDSEDENGDPWFWEQLDGHVRRSFDPEYASMATATLWLDRVLAHCPNLRSLDVLDQRFSPRLASTICRQMPKLEKLTLCLPPVGSAEAFVDQFVDNLSKEPDSGRALRRVTLTNARDAWPKPLKLKIRQACASRGITYHDPERRWK